MVLTEGKENPCTGDDMQRGEGVLIVLRGLAIDT